MSTQNDLAAHGDRLAMPPLSFEHPKLYSCARGTPVVGSGLDQQAWRAARWSEEFVDIAAGPAPNHRTRIKMLWDEEFWYIGAELDEPHLWATLTEHDSVIFQDNDFELFIDPDGDCHNYFEYEINALGTDWDLRLDKPYRNGGGADSSWEWEGVRKSVALFGTLNDPSDTDDKWQIELALPWQAIGLDPKIGARPRVNFSRVQWELRVVDGRYEKLPDRPESNWVWSPQGAVDMHRPEKWGYLELAETAGEVPLDPLAEAQHEAMICYFEALRSGKWEVTRTGFADRVKAEGDFIVARCDAGKVRVRRDSLTARDQS